MDFTRDLYLSIKRAKWLLLWHFRRKFGRIERKIIDEYFSERKIRKLQIGCGSNIRNDWLNSDFFPQSVHILHLDATKPFPFNNDVFDYVFSEHMIEHISYSQGLRMLTECCRILKKGGKIRIATPNLAFLIDLYKNEKSELQKEYIKWATKNFIESAPYYEDTFVINNFVRDWGHSFIYDEKVLRFSLERAGFTNVVKCNLNESEDEALQNLENEKRIPEKYIRLETILLEGTK